MNVQLASITSSTTSSSPPPPCLLFCMRIGYSFFTDDAMDLILIINFCATRNLRISAFSFTLFRFISFFVSLDFLLVQWISVAPIACDSKHVKPQRCSQLSHRRFFTFVYKMYRSMHAVPASACMYSMHRYGSKTGSAQPLSNLRTLRRQCYARGNKLVARNRR